ncbi:arylsulfatase B-like [Littorina saxatilis]|uniref:Sulfatase N-terminal domain-containing protein n=1 Tax=Littorina saxatilis TaxID=31220 RepID=A0AAN9ATP3_9CAEN
MDCVVRLVLLVVSATGVAMAASSHPHIVFIIADDLGWGDVGFHGSEISTPNIDALAYSGIILNKYYVSPICSPTRSAIMTGRHPIHTGMQVGVIGGSTPYGLPLNETIMPQHLETLGYRRHIVGKWHLGFFTEAYLPTRRGFESFLGYYTGHEDYFDHEANEGSMYGLDFHRNEDTLWDVNGNFSTDMYTAEAERIIKDHDPSEPLFLYLAQQSVHAGNGVDPLQVPQKYTERFTPKIKDVKRRIFAGMVSALDDSVGRVVAALRDAGLTDNTIIVFTTDNGGPTNGYDGNAACNWPLRGVKNTMWEGGVRGVGLINSPLLGNNSYVSDNFFHVADWLPTLFHAAGGDPSTLNMQDGFDMFDMLKENGPEIRTDVLHNIDPVNKFAAIRAGDYKLVMGHISKNDNSWYPPPQLSKNQGETKFDTRLTFSFEREFSLQSQNQNVHIFHSASEENKIHENSKFQGSPILVQCGQKPLNASFNCVPEKSPCLFHIPSDPCEFNNVAGSNPDIVQQLLKRLDQYRSTMVAPNNKPNDPNGDPAKHGGEWRPWK